MSDQKNPLLKDSSWRRRSRMWLPLLIKRQLLKPLTPVMTIFMIIVVMSTNYVYMPSVNNKLVLLAESDELATGDNNARSDDMVSCDNNASRAISADHDESSSFNDDLIDKLIHDSDTGDTIFTFRRAGSAEELRDYVRSGRAECGFILPPDTMSRIHTGDTDEMITYVASSYTTKGAVIRETVFAAFFESYGRELLSMSQEDIFGTGDSAITDMIQDRYDELLMSDEVFAADYQTVEGYTAESEEKQTTDPVRGLVMLLITMDLLFIGGERFYGSARRLSAALPSGERRTFDLMLYMAGVLPIAAAGFVLIRALGSRDIPAIADLVFYCGFCLVSVLWTYVIGRLAGNGTLYLSWTLTLLLAQMILCPVWIDISTRVKAMYPVSFLFPTGLYLRVLEFIR